MTTAQSTSSEPKHLPPGLTATVGVVERILGQVVASAEGDALFDVVEGIRREMVAYRDATEPGVRARALDRVTESLRALSIEEKLAVARAYTLFLQLVNMCENAYRTHRLRERRVRESSARASLTFVITAHPTESRSPENIAILRSVQDHVVESLERGRPIDEREVENLLQLAWRVGTHPASKPSVEDEASHLFSLLTDPVLSEVTSLAQAGHGLRFRTWVGGDKDGHPGVGPDQTQGSLQRSRDRLLRYVRSALVPSARRDVDLARIAELESSLDLLEESLSSLASVEAGDAGRIESLQGALDGFQSRYRAGLGVDHPAIGRLSALLEIFPALVVPLELREERGNFAPSAPIAEMMRRLREIARGGSVDGYARAAVVSMTLEAADLLAAQTLVGEVFGTPNAMPVIPLFELPEVLERAPDILRDAWKDPAFRDAVRERGHLEVMLGYSDTAKRMGMLASRVALHDAMQRMGAWADSVGVAPRFFHGHGGSVGRGGGRIEDLAATWPPSALTPYKYTVQGEMVERTFATPEILRSLVEKVAAVQASPPAYCEVAALTRELAAASHDAFARCVASEGFRTLLAAATPYTRLQALTIGSRPSKRGDGGLESLRAIPWVLCWTQTRLLLHAWLGAGEAWRGARDGPEIAERVRRARAEDPLLRSYARLLSFTMAKAEPSLWRRYVDTLLGDAPSELVQELEEDRVGAKDLATTALGSETLLPDRPWLDESIHYRAPMIHPLNLLQIELLAKDEWSDAEVRLFRETVTGIAAGMLTTG